jgi:F0F1-type ATP synthase, subunit b
MPQNIKFILILLLFTNSSFATQADEGKAGLPQLDFNTYPSLIFWSVVSLIIGYLLMKYLVTPNIKSILNNRETNIQNDLVKAKTSSQETEKIKENIINSQTELKSRTQLIVNQALSETKTSIEKKENDINQN